jgi:hypothetical protein
MKPNANKRSGKNLLLLESIHVIVVWLRFMRNKKNKMCTCEEEEDDDEENRA